MTKKKNKEAEAPAPQEPTSPAPEAAPLELKPEVEVGSDIAPDEDGEAIATITREDLDEHAQAAAHNPEDETVAQLERDGLTVDPLGDVVDKPVDGAFTETQIKDEKAGIDAAFSQAAPAPDFKEDPAIQGELIPNENMTRKLKKMTLELVTPFTEEEEMAHGQLVYGLIISKAQIEEEKAEVNKDFKRRVDDLEEQIAELAEIGKAKGMKKTVACEEVVDFIAGLAITRRMDTGEEVQRRPLGHAELQQELALNSRIDQRNTNVIKGGNVIDGPWGRSNAAPKGGDNINLLDTGVSSDHVCAELLKIEGVKSVEVYENATNTVDEDKRPANSVEIVIEGGDGVAIAKRITELLPVTLMLHGNTSVFVETKEFPQVQVMFSRPESERYPATAAPVLDTAAVGFAAVAAIVDAHGLVQLHDESDEDFAARITAAAMASSSEQAENSEAPVGNSEDSDRPRDEFWDVENEENERASGAPEDGSEAGQAADASAQEGVQAATVTGEGVGQE